MMMHMTATGTTAPRRAYRVTGAFTFAMAAGSFCASFPTIG